MSDTIENVVNEVLPMHLGVESFKFERDSVKGVYVLQLSSPNHVMQGYDYSTHYLEDATVAQFLTAPASLARLIDGFLSKAVKEHQRLFYAESMTKEEIPLFSEAVVGYRRWKLTDWVLSPTNYGSPWRPGVNTAKCQPQAHNSGYRGILMNDTTPHKNPPHKDCHCGLNAFFDYQGDNWMRHAKSGSVIGAIVGWGKMEVHPDGFRAEYAQIVALYDAKPGPDLTEVAVLYQVPVVDSFEDLQVEASKHGSPLPENLRPPKQQEDEYGVHRYAGGYSAGLYQYTTQAYGINTSPHSYGTPPQWQPVPALPTPMSASARQAEMLEAAKKANLVKDDGTLKSDGRLKSEWEAKRASRLETARKKYKTKPTDWKSGGPSYP